MLFHIKCKQDRHCNCDVTLDRAGITTVAVEKPQVLHILSVCVCESGLNYTEYRAHALYYTVICGCLAVPYVSTVYHKRHGSREIVMERKMRVFILSTTFV
jgi:hypothetical protein